MNSSSDGVIIHENWSRWLIIIIWACCGVSLLLCICKSIKERCMNLVEDPMQIFRTRPRRRHPSDPVAHELSIHSESRGLPTPIIHSLPSIQFTEEIKGSSTECAVCLSEFLEEEWLRLLPNCGHVFHASCVDTWFCSHSNCPLCRTSVLYGFNICNSENRTEATSMNSSRSHSAINLQ